MSPNLHMEKLSIFRSTTGHDFARKRACARILSEGMLHRSSIHIVPVRQSADRLVPAGGGNLAHRRIMTERTTS